jgi:hypothetical protein
MRGRWVASRGLGTTVFLLAFGAGAEAPEADPALPGPERSLSSDDEEGSVRPTSLALVRGTLTIARLSGSNLVIAIDQSNGSLFASGVDVDGDDHVGRNRSWLRHGDGYGKHPATWTSDANDTVLAVELRAATALVDALAERSRIGVLSFRDAVKIRSQVGDSSAARKALAAIRPSPDWTGTNLARALDIAERMLDRAAASDRKPVARSIVLFTDGRPTAPDGRHWASKRALARARELATRGIAVFTVPIGEHTDPDFLAELASASGGSLLTLEDLRSLVSRRVQLHLDELVLVIENLTVRRRAQSVRVHPDGSFDGIVPIAEGDNLLEIRAGLGDGSEWSERRLIRHEASDPEAQTEGPEAERRLLELRDRLRQEPQRDRAVSIDPSAP